MAARQPNILFIMSDDHAAHAISAYGSKINQTPNIDRIANEGARLDRCLCTNSICTPSRGTILTGQYGHVNGVRTLADKLDGSRPVQVQKLLGQAGYQSAMIGKWHLGHGNGADPAGFDYWTVLPGQGLYHNPEFLDENGSYKVDGYCTEIITDKSLDWLKNRDRDKPFFLMCHHKAPHREWEPGPNEKHMYEDEQIPQPHPDTFNDTYEGRPAAEVAKMRIDGDLREKDVKGTPPEGLSDAERKNWYYQRYIKDYLRCVAAVDKSVGQLLDYLDEEGIAEDTIIIYTSDQGFFLGDHGWYDKRFIYEEALKMPFVIRYPREIKPGSEPGDIFLNNDFAPTFLDYAGVDTPEEMQGVSGRGMLAGETPDDWQQSMYYRYWMHGDGSHNVCAHYGVVTHTHKLVYYYNKPLDTAGSNEGATLEPYWELYDTQADPMELKNIYNDPANVGIIKELKAELDRLIEKHGDVPQH